MDQFYPPSPQPTPKVSLLPPLVEHAPPELAVTGADLTFWLILAGGLLFIGLLALLFYKKGML